MIALQHVGPDEWEKVGSNFDALMQLVVDTGGKNGIGIRFGVATLSWANAQQFSATANVAHGLGRTPLVVLALGNGTGGPNLTTVQAFTIGATTFQLQGGFVTGTSAGVSTVNVGWVAIG